MDKKSFLLYTDQQKSWEKMTDADAGKLVKALIAYASSGIEPELEYPLDVVFSMHKQRMDYDNDAYERRVKSSRENGAKGGRPRKENPENPVGYLGCDGKPKKGDMDMDNVKDKDIDTDMDVCFKRANGAPHTHDRNPDVVLTFCENIETVYMTPKDFAVLCDRYGKKELYGMIKMRALQKQELRKSDGKQYVGLADNDARIINGDIARQYLEQQVRQPQESEPSSYNRDELEDFWNRH